MFSLIALTGSRSEPEVRTVPLHGETQPVVEGKFNELLAGFFVDGAEFHDYEPGYKPDGGDLIQVRYELPDGLSAVQRAVPAAIPHLSKADLQEEAPRALVGVYHSTRRQNARFVFQAIDRRRFLGVGNRLAVILSAGAFRLESKAGVEIDNRLHAVWEDGHLFFESEFMVRRFLSLDMLFQEATDEEVAELLQGPHFADFDPAVHEGMLDDYVRRKIASINRSLIMEGVDEKHLRDVAERCDIELTMDGGVISLPHEKKELKRLLRLLDEDYVEGMLSERVYVSTSKRRLTSSNQNGD